MTTLSTDDIRPSEVARGANEARAFVARQDDTCGLCGSGIIDVRWWVELTHRGRLAHADERFSRTDSRGVVPIDAHCARKIPRAFRLNPGDLERVAP